ncbi:methyl-accepting chemotaxis protein [Stutzerimonas stutzeri]|uniref:HAMP domain-containing protein n=1 Tax=Stutzerimonas stutzeri TaxID=316 RepID=A0A6I6LM21_STUST|nr:methyl-accepting chemotaxis protein [Stutzerimonas stutzeri]QGZ31538.1 HAMP domain-containing protein [Stutzerimonas stutzeri]
MFGTRPGIAGQLGIALSAILAVVITASSLFALRSLSHSTDQAHRQHLASEAKLLADQLATFHATLKTSTQRLATLFERRFESGLILDASSGGTEPSLYLNGERLNGTFTLVDEFTSLTGGAATLFARTGDDFVRVTTSVKKQDGSRAVGTLLERKHPGYSRLIEGQSYVGRATLFGRQYMNQYTPVRDAAGTVIAVLYVGFDYTDTQRDQFDSLSAFRIGKGGSLAVRDEGGQWLVEPAGATDLDALTRAADQSDAAGGFQWSQGNGRFVSMVAPVPGDDWQVVATLPQHEIDELAWSVGGRLAFGSVLALLLAVVASIVLLRHKLRPLGRLVDQAQAFGEGRLSVRMAVDRKDEIGLLSASFNRMAESLGGTVSQVRDSSSDVTRRADQLNTLAAGTEHRSAEQSSQIDTMVSAIEEFSATAQSIADSMQRTEQLTTENVAQTRRGTESMRAASDALSQIARSLGTTGDVVNGLGERSQQIGGIIGVISGIAEQTNLLALNAAIEAARAGEQGRGFAVVADEVRSLAARTSQATREISEMISAVQEETSRAMTAIAGGNRLMQDGLTLNQTVGDALSMIENQAVSTLDQIADIARATHEQSSTASLLSQNLQSIAQDNAANRSAGAELAGTARELKRLAETLDSGVKRFS